MKNYVSGVMLLTALFGPLLVVAQQTPDPSPQNTTNNQTSIGQEGLQSCFDFYRFGSVAVTATSKSSVAAQGATMPLTISVVNENSYPVDDVSVYAKIFYRSTKEKDSFGPDVVDAVILKDHLTLKAGEKIEFPYTWKVPAGLEPGEYQVATYVASHDRFNLAGLTFTNDVVGNLFGFTVVGEAKGSVRFDNTQTLINGVNFHAAAFPPKADVKSEGVPVSAVVRNTTGASYAGTISWKAYSWDGINERNLLAQSSEKITVPAHGSTTVTYLVADSVHTVYYVVAELDAGAGTAKSILPMRYVLTDEGSAVLPRIAFVGTTEFPSKKGETKAFVCLHSTGTTNASNVEVTLTATPIGLIQKILHFGGIGTATYSGVAPGRVAALAVPLTASLDAFKVTAKISQNGALIDEVTSTFSCSELQDSCSKSSYIYVAAAGASLLVLIAVIVGIVVFRRRKSRMTVSNTLQ